MKALLPKLLPTSLAVKMLTTENGLGSWPCTQTTYLAVELPSLDLLGQSLLLTALKDPCKRVFLYSTHLHVSDINIIWSMNINLSKKIKT